jgi:hypothetical protein
MVRAARRAGESCAAIKEVVREELIESGCEETTCDCEKLYVLVSLGIAVAAAAIAYISKNRIAAAEAREAIGRAMRTAKDAAQKKELRDADKELEVVDVELEKAEEELVKLLDRLTKAEQDSFSIAGREALIVIKKGAE